MKSNSMKKIEITKVFNALLLLSYPGPWIKANMQKKSIKIMKSYVQSYVNKNDDVIFPKSRALSLDKIGD